jgi:hypothetical protein
MDYILTQLQPLLLRISYFVEQNIILIAVIAAALYIFSSVVGICLFGKTKIPSILGALPIVRVIALFCYLGIFPLLFVDVVSAVGLIALDVLAFTAPSTPELYYAFMPLFIVPSLIVHTVFSVKLSKKFYMRWYHALLAVFLPVIFIPLVAFGGYDTFDIRYL